ncbi:DUF1573 domain-containing protein [Sphingobacterium sp. UT-1RO-CII-1]|uniref:DUF1573 domain-containing protein n=1 Tax=Sphingobacterium sp. UT-1RO-CII-1 TaxID=2995225 RepID=UPI00227BC86A|nr:DUF1573 domain-containing protein [Sphingobacterium sp. UT-1RO-CII-1]MCY4780184.1 DUF1573 domain-containing protein [Sphingobacterium sp. UT-1RO-CII-1]
MNFFKIGILSVGLTTLVSCGSSSSETKESDVTEIKTNNSGDAALGKLEFVESVFDFGEIKEGEVVEHMYIFENKGTAPIILSQVSASCGCTTPSYTQTPILPGKQGEVKVVFDSNGQVGKQQKIITVVSNAENNVTTVQLRGEVVAK